MKLRLSYGVSGNNDIGNYPSIASVSNGGYVLGDSQNFVNAIYASGLANPYLTWETKKSWNLGLDLGLFNNRIQFVADAYKSNTDGLLLNVNIPSVSGFGSTIENTGEVENKGLELALTTRNLVDEFQWTTSMNIAFNRNKVISLGGSAGDFISSGMSRTVVGAPMGRFYVRVTDGIFNSQEEIDAHAPQDNNPYPGFRRFKDVNGDGRVDNSDQDFVGDPNPDFTYGITNTFSYKGFDLSVLINGSYGNDIFYNYVGGGANLNGNLNQDAVVLGRWKSPEDPGSGNVPRAVYGFSSLSDADSDFFIHDGSFLRLSNVTLGYQFPLTVEKVGLKSARVYVSGENLLTITDYPGYDPESAASGGNPLQFGVDEGIYPMARTISFGLNLNF